jgi:sphingosine kinase
LSLSWGLVAGVDIDSEVLRCLGSLRMDIYAVWRMTSLRKYHARLTYHVGGGESGAVVEMPELKEPLLGPEWKVIEDDFVTLWVCQTTHASYDIMSSPHSKMNDGKFHILVLRGSISRLQLLNAFLVFEDGGHANLPYVEIIECDAFRLEPSTNGSHHSVDGEEVTMGPIQACVQPGAWKVFC